MSIQDALRAMLRAGMRDNTAEATVLAELRHQETDLSVTNVGLRSFPLHRDDRWPDQDHRWRQRLHGSFPNPSAARPGSRYIPYRPDNETWLNAAEDPPWL